MKFTKTIWAILWCAFITVVRLACWLIGIPVAIILLLVVGVSGASIYECVQTIKGLK